MEDTKSLLMMVMQKVFANRPQIVEETFQLIYNYNNSKREKAEYEKTLKTICDLMNDELSSQTLVYLLTMVDMPKEGGGQLPIMEKMQKTHNCLAESVRPHLLEYLKKKPESNLNKNDETKNQKMIKSKETKPISTEQPEDKENIPDKTKNFIKPVKRPKRKPASKKNQKIKNETEDNDLQNLLDICANYVVRNELYLQKLFKSKLNKSWRLIKKNVYQGDDLLQCYEVVKDLNHKLKLLRMIESENISTDILREEFTDHEIFLREKHMQHLID